MMNHRNLHSGASGGAGVGVNVGGTVARVILNSAMTIKRESFEQDLSSSAEFEESEGEIGSFKAAEVSDEQLRKLSEEKIIR